jgi:hypothetical protein
LISEILKKPSLLNGGFWKALDALLTFVQNESSKNSYSS